MASNEEIDMFRPPIARGIRTLDRAIFQKTVPLKAARVFDNKNISKIRTQLERSRDALQQERLGNVYPDPDVERAEQGKKCILLRPEVQPRIAPSKDPPGETNGDVDHDTGGLHIRWPHSSTVTELAQQNLISVIPYDLRLSYDYWTYHDIISSILPLDAQDEIPSGFSQVGHVAHLNLRDEYLPYKHLIAEILMDKNPGVRTVINKIDDVGEENEFRTFRYEVLAGPDDLNVELSEENCTFRFDYGKVYWNTRLNTEHRRLVSLFREGEAVCDVMAGVGPFAVPAGKRGVFVWANDLNPAGYASLEETVKRNRVGGYVRAFNEDGRSFIRTAVRRLAEEEEHHFVIQAKRSRKEADAKTDSEAPRTVTRPKTFQHFILNLPATAITFLPSFVGLYPPALREKLPRAFDMPMVHVYCFSTKDEQAEALDPGDETGGAAHKICAQVSEQLGFEMKAGKAEEGGVEVYDVRDVAPRKRMFCASFRLPEEVAFRCT